MTKRNICCKHFHCFTDIDECATPGTCVQNCEDTIGSYTCSCDAGYFLNTDKRTCGGN